VTDARAEERERRARNHSPKAFAMYESTGRLRAIANRLAKYSETSDLAVELHAIARRCDNRRQGLMRRQT
jgi:hypothetical protein